MEVEEAQTTPKSMNENEWKSNKCYQAVGTSTEHKQPQASTNKGQMSTTKWQGQAQVNTQLSRHKCGGTNVSKGRSRMSGGRCGDE